MPDLPADVGTPDGAGMLESLGLPSFAAGQAGQD
jgi:hypothetical protein